MRRGRSTCNPTKAEALWLRSVKEAGCVCCAARGYYRQEGGPLAEAHHLLSGGIRRRLLGPSLAEGSVPFHEAFGDDEALMAATHALIARQTTRAA